MSDELTLETIDDVHNKDFKEVLYPVAYRLIEEVEVEGLGHTMKVERAEILSFDSKAKQEQFFKAFNNNHYVTGLGVCLRLVD